MKERILGVGISGIGWCAAEHIKAFGRNPHARVTFLHGRDEDRARKKLASYGINVPDARFTTRYEDLLEADEVDIVSITTPNHLHADQAVTAARAGKHIVLEKPTGLNVRELKGIRDAVRRARVRTIVSFELHYNPYLRFVHWLRAAGRLGRIRFARVHEGLRVADDDRGEREAREGSHRPRDQLHGLHAALHIRRGADGGSSDVARHPHRLEG